MKNVFIVGSGIMGTGIAQVCLQSGFRVTIMDLSKRALARAVGDIERSLHKLAEKGKLKQRTAADAMARLETAESPARAKNADIVIEAAAEEIGIKQDIFRGMESVCARDTVFGTNTSSIPITEIASVLKTPQRFAGIHFFNPVFQMKLVEIIKGLSTSDTTVEYLERFARKIGKEPVTVNRDQAGFIVNRINGMAVLEALRLLEKGVASVEDIDKAMRLGLGSPVGPFQLMDLVGLDIVLNSRMGIYNETREPAHFPPGILRNMVRAGHLGRKTGKGFYQYQ